VRKLSATVVSVNVGSSGSFGKDESHSIQVELDGVVGDRHRSFQRETWTSDKQPPGTVRRNERQWSAVSVEELAAMAREMDIAGPLTAGHMGANLGIAGIDRFSRLPRGTLLSFPSGAVLMVEEYNPPCLDMAKKLAAELFTRSGRPLSASALSKAAMLTRGLVGVVEVPGMIRAGWQERRRSPGEQTRRLAAIDRKVLPLCARGGQSFRTILPTKFPDSSSLSASWYCSNGNSRSITGFSLCAVMNSLMRR